MSPHIVGPVEVSGPEILDRIGRFRFDVWAASGLIVPEAFPGGTWRDPLDDVARHWIIEVDGRLAGAVRYAQFDRQDDLPQAAWLRSAGVVLEPPIGLPERLVVAPEHQRHGLSERLIAAYTRVAREQGARCFFGEVAPRMVAHLLAAGRRDLGPAEPDPRFRVAFRLLCRDLPREP